MKSSNTNGIQLLFFSIFIIISMVIISCSSSTEPENIETTAKVKIESAFAKNGALTEKANKIIIVHLESLNSPDQDDTVDTGTIGMDNISLSFDDASYTFEIEGDCDYTISINDYNNNAALYELDDENRKGTFNLVGDYVFTFQSQLEYDTNDPKWQHLFIRPDANKEGAFIITNNKCQNADFSGSNLSYENFENVDLSNSIFDNSEIVNASFRYGTLTGASFQNCNLYSTYMSRANLNDATFKGSNLRYSFFNFAKAHGTNFCQTERYGMSITGLEQSADTKCKLYE